MSGASTLSALLSMFDTSTPPLTLLRVAAGVRMIGPPVDGVVALLVLTGTMHLEIDDEPARTVRQGRLALIPAGKLARLSAGDKIQVTVDGRQCLVRRDGWLMADATRGREAALVVGAGRIAGSGPEALPEPVVSAVTKCRIGKPVFSLLREECARGTMGQPALANALMNACVVQGLRRAIDRTPGEAGGSQLPRGRLAGAIAAVRAQPAERHTIDTLARIAGMSRSSFIRHFKQHMQLGPSEYVMKVRLDEARTMLLSTDLPITTVAARSGFVSRSHFSRTFRSEFGSDPSSFRGMGGENPTT